MKKLIKFILMKINHFFHHLWTILCFAKNDLKKRYAGSVGGFLWAYIQPLVSILVFWFVFQIGFKNPPVENIPFILWLVPSYIAWSYANDSISQSSNVLYEYNYLVKKVKFKIHILPVIKVATALIVHLFFIIFVYCLYLGYGYSFHISWLQVLYYTFALTILLVGISWLVSSLSVFWKDISQIVNVLLQIGFWMAPVFWNPDSMNPSIVQILKLNPFYYIINGYRDCFITHNAFWNYTLQSIYFWSFTIIIFAIGALVFKKLSRHYPDLL
ncbi:MAG: ABC transporter permease [Anaeroplasma sp.]